MAFVFAEVHLSVEDLLCLMGIMTSALTLVQEQAANYVVVKVVLAQNITLPTEQRKQHCDIPPKGLLFD